MEQIDLLKDKGILVTEVKNKRKELWKLWEEAFANNLTKSQKRKIYFHQHMWHVFSYNKISCNRRTKCKDCI